MMNRKTKISLSKWRSGSHCYDITLEGEPFDILQAFADISGFDLSSYNYDDWKPCDCDEETKKVNDE